MQQRKLCIQWAMFPYNGNSTGTSLTWPTALWFAQMMVRLKTEEKFTGRVHDVFVNSYPDTPITMNRNAAVRDARRAGADILVMIDSDMKPDVHVGEHPDAVPFLDAAFDRIYSLYDKGPRLVAAPYGGSPPYENQFQFLWDRHPHIWSRHANLGDEAPYELRQYTREEVMYLSGIQEAAAAATGVIMYDMRCFDLIEPPYFRYEWTDETESKKASTEDVQNTRDISLAGIHQLGYNPCEIAWSSWAGHLKNWCVKKPQPFTAECVSASLKRSMSRPNVKDGKIVQLENMIDQSWFGGNGHAGEFARASRLQGADSPGQVTRVSGANLASCDGDGTRHRAQAEAQG